MRIGELAALVGVSPRAIRHYHRLGLLPEPERLPNGYRSYRLKDAVELARVRRLAELGLTLAEIRDVLAEDEGRDLRSVLAELDADLARQEAAIAVRRTRLATLLADPALDADTAVSPDLAAVLRDLPPAASRFAELDRQLLAVIDTGADPEQQAQFSELFRPLTTPAAVDRAEELYARLDALADAAVTDPAVEALAADLADQIPPAMAQAMSEHIPDPADAGGWLDAMTQELGPAPAQVLRRMVELVRERTC